MGARHRRVDHRRRLRRRIPLRPPPGRGATGAGSPSDRLRRNREQDAGPGTTPGLARPPFPADRRDRRRQGPRRPQHQRDRSAHARRVHRLRGLRPARPPLAAELPPAPRQARGGARATHARRPNFRHRRRPTRAGRASDPAHRGGDRRSRGPAGPFALGAGRLRARRPRPCPGARRRLRQAARARVHRRGGAPGGGPPHGGTSASRAVRTVAGRARCAGGVRAGRRAGRGGTVTRAIRCSSPGWRGCRRGSRARARRW